MKERWQIIELRSQHDMQGEVYIKIGSAELLQGKNRVVFYDSEMEAIKNLPNPPKDLLSDVFYTVRRIWTNK